MRHLLAALTVLLTMAPAQSQDETMTPPDIPLLSVTLKPEEAIERGGYVQGQLVLQVRVISKFSFDELHLEVPEVTGAKVIRLVRPRTREVRSYAGDGFLFETAFAIFPLRSGTLTISGVSVQGVVEPQVGVEEHFASTSPDLKFDIHGIDRSYRADWWLVADRIDMAETWSKPLDELRVGDTVRREVVVTAFGATAEQIPPIEHGRTQGIVVVEAGRSDATELSRDGVIATVTQAWDLRIDPVEVAYVSPVNLAYWNPLTGIEERATAPGYRIEPLPADRAALAAELLSEADMQHDRNRLAMGVVLALVLVALCSAWSGRAVVRGADSRRPKTGSVMRSGLHAGRHLRSRPPLGAGVRAIKRRCARL